MTVSVITEVKHYGGFGKLPIPKFLLQNLVKKYHKCLKGNTIVFEDSDTKSTVF